MTGKRCLTSDPRAACGFARTAKPQAAPLSFLLHVDDLEPHLAQHVDPGHVLGAVGELDVGGVDALLVPGRVDADPLIAVVVLRPGVPAERLRPRPAVADAA